jgi:hypothetical protein
MNVGGKLPLDNVQQLIPGAEQADHRVVSGYHDLYLGPCFTPLRVAVGTAAGV